MTDEELGLNIPEISKSKILKEFITPDKDEIYLFISGIIIAILIIQPTQFAIELIPFVGIMNIILYSFRWSYTSIFHYISRNNNIEKRMNKEKIFDFKIIGLLMNL